MTYIHAWSTEPSKVIYRDGTGTESVREGGTRSWRNCNPGNIRPSTFTELHGAIGVAGGFAVFPDEQTGFATIVALLKTPVYQALTVLAAFARYAPASDDNSPVGYANRVARQTGLPVTRLLSACTEQDLTALAGAIRTEEGWEAGTEGPASS